MTTPSADEVYEQFKVALESTIGEYDPQEDSSVVYQIDNGTSDWTLNDQEHVLIAGLTAKQRAQFLCHLIMLLTAGQDRYISEVGEISEGALAAIESDEEYTDEEKIIAADLVETAADSQTDGFIHCVALIYGYARAAITTDEGETVDWDSIFKEEEGVGE